MNRLLGVSLLSLMMATPALADAIDGNWCGPEGGRITIEGSKVTTPKGAEITGSYSRHYFTYVVPDGEPKQGGTVHMDLVNDETVHLRTQTRSGAPESGPQEIWKRCQVIS